MSGLHLDRLTHRYGQVTTIDDLTLHLPTGARHAVIGPNGAGKTTLLHLIAGTRTPNPGRILFHGTDITRWQADRRARHGIARTFQHPGVIADLTVAQNLTLATPRHSSRRPAEVVAGILDRISLTVDPGARAGRLSYGQQRLLEIGMALAGRPQLLLLDEPSAGLSPADITHLATVLHQLAEQTTIILVDHHLDLVWQFADTVTVLHHGRHLTTGPADEVRAHPAARDAYLNTTPATPRRRHPTGTGTGGVLLHVDGLRAGFQHAAVIDDLHLHVDTGTVHAVLGRNGAGKTTLLNTIAGLHPADGGSISLAGTHLRSRQPWQVAGHGVALVPQGRRLWHNLTVDEHLRLAAHPSRSSRDQVFTLLPDLRDLLRRYPHQLSGGQQQMVALARALLTRPRLLLLDEPSEGLAPALAAQLAAAVTDIAATGVTVLLAEQNLPVALAAADHVTVLDRGQAALHATTASLTTTTARSELEHLLGLADHDTASQVQAEVSSSPGAAHDH
jgi:branched-chain amino acid transport system ATP-binding protein